METMGKPMGKMMVSWDFEWDFEWMINPNLGICQRFAMEHGPVEIVDFPIKSGDFPVRYVELPKGRAHFWVGN